MKLSGVGRVGLQVPTFVARALALISAQYALFERTIRNRPSRRAVTAACVMGVAAFAILAALAPEGLQFGDGPLYATQIENGDLSRQTIHIGYYMLGIAFTRLLPLDLSYALNLMNALAGALSVSVVALLAYTLAGRLSASLAAAGTLLTSLVFLDNAFVAEVYVPQLLFFLLCVQLALWDRPVEFGLSFALAFLITPSTLLCIPFLVLLRPKKRFLLIAAIAAATPIALVLGPRYQDFLWGGRGLLRAQTTGVDLVQALRKETRELSTFFVTIVLVIVGLATLVKSSRHRLFCIALLLLWAFPLVLGERFSDVPVQLPLYGMLAVVAGIGFAGILHRFGQTRAATIGISGLLVAAIAISAVYNIPKALEESRSIEAYRERVDGMRSAAQEGDIFLAPGWMGILVEYYLRDSPMEWASLEGLGDAADTDARAVLNKAVAERRRIWLPMPTMPALTQYLASTGYRVESAAGVSVAVPVQQ